MSTYRLDKLFSPRSVAVVGASPRESSAGHAVLRNLRRGGFAGTIHLVNPRYDAIEGIPASKSYDKLPAAPDVAIIVVPAAAVPSTVAAAAQKGTALGVILTAGLGRGPGSLADQCRTIARAVGMRLVGPNCLGVLVPGVKLNASFAASMPPAGDLALVSQSGAIAAGLVEWASAQGVGFSAVVSIGDSIDVDFADLLDHFAMDRATRAILLYVESIGDARKFMSAARAAARAKPVLVVKSGRQALGAKAALTHTGALAGSDAVYDAAFRRAGLLRVLDLDELDERLYGPFLAAVSREDLRLRFFAPVKDFSHAFIARFTQIDYARAMAFLAIDEASGEMLGVVRLHADAAYERGEYAVLVRSDLKSRGLGWLLMQMIVDYARVEGIRVIEGQVLRENTTMLNMCRELGFEIASDPEEADVQVVKLRL
jgi:succinyl-CoA synthetase alpha subunit/N-acetylglutamate synthase-like GNAT family acetyltransferase